MIAAIYARKSTEQGGVADEARSVTRQIEHARAFAVGKGWTVDPSHIYVDDGISGAEFVNRPGLSALLAALSPRPPFDVLLMAEASRLGREQIETSWTLKRITDAGVRVFFYLENREAVLDTPAAKVMASLAGFASETERMMARARTYDALQRKAKSGHVTGGTVFGYQNVRVDGHVERRIDEAEAAVVRRIFADYANGTGLKALAATLTRERAPVPVPRRRNRMPGWAPSALHAMLGRELYIGITSWGARKKTDVGGRTKVRRWRPETERIRVEVPGLRIVDEACWQAVQARRTAHATARGTWTRGPAPAPALLAGLARCAQCGGGLMRRGRTHGSGTRRVRIMVYGCGAHARNHSCGNAVELPETTMDTAVLESLARALEPATIEAAVQEAVEQERAARAGSAVRRAALERELTLIDARTARLTEAVAAGGAAVGPLLAKLSEETTRRQAIERERGGLDALDGAADFATAAVRRALLRQASQVRAALLAHRDEARDVLRAFVPAITFTPYGSRRGRGYTFKGTGTYGPLLGETPRPNGVPDGIQPGWSAGFRGVLAA